MFCPKCGKQIPQNGAFCPQCGNMINRGGTTTSPVIKTSKRAPKIKWIVLVLCLATIVIISLSCLPIILNQGDTEEIISGRGTTISVQTVGTSGTPALPPTTSEDLSEENAQKDLTELVVNEPTLLEGNYENLQTLVSNGAQVTLSGNFPSLTNVTMNPGSDGITPDFVFEYGTLFPSLNSFSGGTIRTTNYSQDGFWLDAFQTVESMELYAKNREIDEDWQNTLACATILENIGTLKKFDYKISHDISDLYGTWTDAKNTLSLTFQKNGEVRVAESGNLIGVDLLSYTEMDDNTLSLYSGSLDALIFGSTVLSGQQIISIYADYELNGDTLIIDLNFALGGINSHKFVLTRVE